MNLGTILAALAPFLAFLEQHSDLVELIFQAITSGALSKEDVQRLINDALVAASDAEMKREFPKG